MVGWVRVSFGWVGFLWVGFLFFVVGFVIFYVEMSGGFLFRL